MIHIGFTGSRHGMSGAQAAKVWELVRHHDFYAHHGDCIGSDAAFDDIVRRAPNLRGVVIHPSTAETRAFCRANYPYDVVHEPKDPIERDHDIVDASALMIATPRETQMLLRSGTWTTIRYARKVGRKLYIVFPDGGLLTEGLDLL